VECRDIYENKALAERKFTVEGGDETEETEEEVINEEFSVDYNYALEEIESILERMNNYATSEKEASDALELRQRLERQRKELKQIRRDIFNLRYKTDSIEEEQDELTLRAESIKKGIIQDIRVVESDEYVKYPADEEIEELTRLYIEAHGITGKKKEIKNLISANKDLQKLLTVSTKNRIISLTYLNGTSAMITLIEKRMGTEPRPGILAIESIPKEHIESADAITFLSDVEIMDPLISVLEDKLVYYVEGEISLEDLQGFKTFLTYEELNDFSQNSITGFAALGGITDIVDVKTSIVLSILLSLIVYLLFNTGIFSFTKLKKLKAVSSVFSRFGKDREMQHKIGKARMLAKDKLVKEAQQEYISLQESFRKMPKDHRSRIKGSLIDLSHAINHAHLNCLVADAVEMLSMNRHDEASRMYPKVRSVASMLPTHMRKDAYSKVEDLGHKINSNFIVGLIDKAHRHIDMAERDKAHKLYAKIQTIYRKGTKEMKAVIHQNAMELFERLR